MCRTAGETHMGARPDDPTGPTHSGYRQYSLGKVLSWSLLGLFAGVGFNLAIGYYLYAKSYDDAVLGIWERLDPATATCKYAQRVQAVDEYTLGMPDDATKFIYRLVCDTDAATADNSYPNCQIGNVKDYGCPESAVEWYSYFVGDTIAGVLNAEVNLNRDPIVCCVEQCPEWTQFWYCAPEHYNDSKICDCECGYPDPDCAPEVTIAGFRGCCHEDYVAFGTDHLIGCLNGSSPGAIYQQACYEDLRCNVIYSPPQNVLPFPCGFEATRNTYTMPTEISGLQQALMWLYTAPVTGILLYLMCLAAYPAFALCCGLRWKPDKRKVMNDPIDPPPRILNLKRQIDD